LQAPRNSWRRLGDFHFGHERITSQKRPRADLSQQLIRFPLARSVVSIEREPKNRRVQVKFALFHYATELPCAASPPRRLLDDLDLRLGQAVQLVDQPVDLADRQNPRCAR